MTPNIDSIADRAMTSVLGAKWDGLPAGDFTKLAREAAKLAVEECITTAKRNCPKAGGHTEKGWCTACGLMIEQLEALLPPDDAGECAHPKSAIIVYEGGQMAKCQLCGTERRLDFEIQP
jgi:hypothetical protein